MHTRFIVFISIITVVLGVSLYYVGSRVIRHTAWGAHHKGVIWLTLALFLILQFAGPIIYRTWPSKDSDIFALQWVVYTTLGVFACMFFYTFASDILVLLWKKLLKPENSIDLDRRSFLTVSALTAGTAAIGTIQALGGPKIYEVEVPLEGLPQEFDGYKIAQISDLHVGPTIGKKYVENVVKMTNSLAPDLVALTGDFVDGTVDQLRKSVAPLAQIISKDGMFFATGNHEYYWGVEQWLEEFKNIGSRVLLNEHVVIKRGESHVVLAGVTDVSGGEHLSSHASDAKKSIEGAPHEAVKILLAHHPRSYEDAHAAGFHLQLSGHTHGGQFFPWGLLVKFAHKYYKGLNRHENMWVYVNRGTGYWGPPLRFAIPSEITLLRLKRV